MAFSVLYAGQYLFLGMQLPFFPVWLEAKGYGPGAIGVLVGTALFLRLIFAPIVAYRFEGFEDRRTGLRIISGGLFALSVVLLFPVPLPFISVAAIGFLFVFGLFVPLTDTAVLRADRRGDLSYGQARGMGSAAFIVANLLGGAFIAATSESMIVKWMAGAAAVGFAAAWLLPREPEDAETGRARPSIKLAMKLFRSRSFLLMLFAGGLCQGTHATYYSFSALHWTGLGYSSVTIGMLWTTGVVIEIILLLLARPLISRIDPAALIAIGALGALIRWPITGLSPPLYVLFVVQGLHALTFAATYLGTVEFLGRAVPDQYRATAMTLVSTLGVGAMTGIATMIAGQIFDAQAPFPAYLFMAALGAGSLGLALMLRRRWDGGPLAAVA